MDTVRPISPAPPWNCSARAGTVPLMTAVSKPKRNPPIAAVAAMEALRDEGCIVDPGFRSTRERARPPRLAPLDVGEGLTFANHVRTLWPAPDHTMTEPSTYPAAPWHTHGIAYLSPHLVRVRDLTLPD